MAGQEVMNALKNRATKLLTSKQLTLVIDMGHTYRTFFITSPQRIEIPCYHKTPNFKYYFGMIPYSFADS